MRQIPRLFVDQPLAAGALVELDGPPAHYLGTVLRLEPGARLHLFDDRTGEWQAEIAEIRKRQILLLVQQNLRNREKNPDLWLLAAPIRAERYEWIVEKATELGVSRIIPVLTERTNHHRLKPERLRAHMVEAAEQCGRTALPVLETAVPLADLLACWDRARALLFADEAGGEAMPKAGASAILIGPEGGFSDAERAAIKACAGMRAITLGPRILRADTAAVAAIAQWLLVQSPALVPPASGG